MAGHERYAFAYIAISLLILFHFASYIIAGLINPLRHLSGPWHTRFSGLSLKAATLAGRRIHYVHALHEQYGRYVRISPSEVAVMDPAGFQRIHALSAGFEKTKWYQEMVLMERPGIFSMSGGKTHSDRRRLLSRPFSKSLLRQTWEPTVRHYTEAAVTRMLDERSEKSKNKNVDILKWWTFMASDISAHLMFGESFHTMESGKVSRYTQLLQNALKGGGIGAELPWLRAICSRIPLRVFQDAFNGNTELMQYGEAAVRNMKAADGGSNIFSNMLRQAQDGELLDERDVQVEATNLIVAGTDTTAITLTYLVWAVLSRPALQAALVAELETLSENHSDADLERLPLLNGVVKETLRLYGAAPGGLPRAVPAGGIELGGFRFPAGSTLTTQSFSLHRDPTLFPSPEEFEPRRFLQGSEWYLSDGARAVYSPFGAGARTCLGIHLAYMELRCGAAEFFRRCPNASLARETTAESMVLENYFLIAPQSHACYVALE